MAVDNRTIGGIELMRRLSSIRRANLVIGNKIDFMDSGGNRIADPVALQMPQALFNAASSKPNTVVAGHIVVPEYVELAAVKYLISQILKLPAAARVSQLRGVNDTFRDLHICSAADELGMSKFYQGLYNSYFARVNTVVPTTTNIDAICSVNTPKNY